MRAFKPGAKIVVTSANAKLKPWRQQVTSTAIVESARQKFALIKRPLAVDISLEFYFDRPKSFKAAGKTTKPDVDKLCRGALDALKGVVYEDDSQVTDVCMKKRFGSPANTVIIVKVAEVL